MAAPHLQHAAQMFSEDDDVVPDALDDETLNMRFPGAGGMVPGGAGAGAGRGIAGPAQFVRLPEAMARLSGEPVFEPDETELDGTSCDELGADPRVGDARDGWNSDPESEDDDDTCGAGAGAGAGATGQGANARARRAGEGFESVLGTRGAEDPSIDLGIVKRHEEPCFGCVFSTRADLGGGDDRISGRVINELVTLFQTQLGRIDDVTLARMLHQKFKQEIWLPVQHPGVASPVPLWRSRQIYEHFFNHTMDPHVHVLRRMRRYRMIGNALSHTIFMVNPVPGSGPDVIPVRENLKLMVMVDGRLDTYAKAHIDTHNFCPEGAKVNYEQLGAHVNPARDFRKEGD